MAQPTTPVILSTPNKALPLVTQAEREAYAGKNTGSMKHWMDPIELFTNRGGGLIKDIARDPNRKWSKEGGYKITPLEWASGVRDHHVHRARLDAGYSDRLETPLYRKATEHEIPFNRDTKPAALEKKVSYASSVASAKDLSIPTIDANGKPFTTSELNTKIDIAKQDIRDEVTGKSTVGRRATETHQDNRRLVTEKLNNLKFTQGLQTKQFNFQVSEAKEAVIEAARERNAQRELQRLQNTANIEQVQLQNDANRERWQAELDWHKQNESENRIQAILAGLFALGGAVAI